MAEISFECSKCGNLNNASSFFAKKVIQCKFCGAKNNIKGKKLSKKYCAFCVQSFSFEQSLEKKICPSCGCDLGIIEDMLQNITFGSYPQDINYNEQPIEWEFLERWGKDILLISKYGLDCKVYMIRGEPGEYVGYMNYICWDNCALRLWLNDDFVRKAFSYQEQAMLRTHFIKKEPVYVARNTEDKVFLLSIDEAQEYAKAGLNLRLKPTAYANARKEGDSRTWRNTKFDEGNICWWLRSYGEESYLATAIDECGYVDRHNIYYKKFAIRPVIRIDLKEYLLYKGYCKNNI